MSESDDSTRSQQREQLEALYRAGLIDEESYRTALERLDQAKQCMIDQKSQRVEKQTNIAVQMVSQTGTDPAALKGAYLSNLINQTQHLPLTGVDPKAAHEATCRQLKLSAVYTALMTQTPSAPELRDTREFRQEIKIRRLSALEMLNKEPHLVLLGDPGSGKSTFVNFVAACLAGAIRGDADLNLATLTAPMSAGDEQAPREKRTERAQTWDHGPILPVRIVLRDLAARGLPAPGEPVGADTLWRFIQSELGESLEEFAIHLKKTLQEQGGLILLDGLDEVPDAKQRRLQVKHAVQGFAGFFPKCRMLVTSRTYAYQHQQWQLDGFAASVLSPFTPQQIQRFICKWYDHVALVRGLNAQDAQGRAVLLTASVARNARLAELAARPILLTLMASLHAWRGGTLPEKREELYADAVDLLLDQWESPKVVRDSRGSPIVSQPSLAEWLKTDRAAVRGELDRTAFEAHRDQPELVGTADIAQERLVAALMNVTRSPEVNPAWLVEYIRDRAGLLAARGEGVYSFPHRTFQEYLAACYLTDTGFPEQVVELLRDDPQRWREVLLLAGAKAARGTAAAVWTLAEELCRDLPPPQAENPCPDADFWAALLAGQTLMENERKRLDKVLPRNQAKLETIRRWQLAIVEQGRLASIERTIAGETLAVLGDDRDLEALVDIAAGSFWMGDDGDPNASPGHEFYLPAFKIGRFPVTNAQYRRFVQAQGRQWNSPDGFRVEKSNCPATNVTWHEARDYCAWLTELWRLQGKIRADEIVFLPSEAQWEKAARGSDGRQYPWGDAWDAALCNTAESRIGQTTPVGIFPDGASPFGCLDMAGNVFEWTRSLWGKEWGTPDFRYPYNPDDGRENTNAADEVLHVLRGGAWSYGRDYARCAYRFGLYPFDWVECIGFRVAVSPISGL
jgi:formylglycine-generating enzyme required for sulfatase activity